MEEVGKMGEMRIVFQPAFRLLSFEFEEWMGVRV
jgi:hypothetical protein